MMEDVLSAPQASDFIQTSLGAEDVIVERDVIRPVRTVMRTNRASQDCQARSYRTSRRPESESRKVAVNTFFEKSQSSRSISFPALRLSDVIFWETWFILCGIIRCILLFQPRDTCVPSFTGRGSWPLGHRRSCGAGMTGFTATINSAGADERTLHSRQHSHRVAKGWLLRPNCVAEKHQRSTAMTS